MINIKNKFAVQTKKITSPFHYKKPTSFHRPTALPESRVRLGAGRFSAEGVLFSLVSRLSVSASLDGGIPGLSQIGIDLLEKEFGIVRFAFPVRLDPPQEILGQRVSSVGIHLASPF